ncbi:hypothetical protein BDV26DRAFT_286145 [Aspergillus bertholletiae]|uniref:Ubiquitin 3 binding protein But2 C-terminal domain-containing protein n=1 Tax=Aspergillus bertholletiae TaxID=1226010 RepID=A0A5N7AT45_9EURO|nr:hypothetical protein BDV26DRAFT_286145 [Aspergillus bertholletiae]
MSSSIAFIAALFSAANAVPTPAELLPRACTTVAPSYINILDAANPNTPYPGQQFTLERGGSPLSDNKISVVTFANLPAGATGCQLAIELPPLSKDQIAPGDIQADVRNSSPVVDSSVPTYNNPPQKGNIVSTYIFPEGPTTQSAKTILVSNTCSTTMSWLVQLSEWQTTGGSVNFANTAGNGGNIGFSLIYNC